MQYKNGRRIARQKPPLPILLHIGIETEKENKKDFSKCQKEFEFGMKFQLDSKTLINSASKLKAIKLNNDVS